jgi:hypothetical protein
MKKLALFLMVAAISATSVSAQPGGSKSSLLFSNASLPADARYELKSAIIKYEGTSQGIQITATGYIDDYGKKESTLSVTGTALVKTEIKVIQFGDTIYQINMGMKMGQKTALPEKPVNYLQLTSAVREKYKVQELGEETIAGKSCKKYSLEVTQMGQTVKTEVCVWKGLVLKSVLKMGDVEIATQTATEVQENAEIDPKVFELPEGVSMM